MFDHDVLAGCGGVGTGFLWGLQTIETSGTLTVVDSKNVSKGNLTRCFFYDEEDVDKPKAERLAARALLNNTVLEHLSVRSTISFLNESASGASS